MSEGVVIEFKIGDDFDHCAFFDVSEVNGNFAFTERAGVASDAFDANPAGGFEVEFKVDPGGADHFAEFGAEYLWDHLGFGDVIVVSSGFFGHGGKEFFVVFGSETEVGGGDSALFDVPGVRDKGLEIFDSGGGFAISENDHAGDATCFDGLAELLGAEGDSVVEVGGVSGLDLGDAGFDGLFVGDALGSHEDFDDFIEDNDGEDICGAEEVYELVAGLLGVLDGLTLHAARSVDDEAEVEGGSFAGGGHSGEAAVGRGGDFEEELFASGAVRHGGGSGGGEDEAEGLAGREGDGAIGVSGSWGGGHRHGLIDVGGADHGSIGIERRGNDGAVGVVLVHEEIIGWWPVFMTLEVVVIDSIG